MALKTDLVSYWKLNGDVTDAHGSYDGSNTGCTSETGKSGNCYQALDNGDYCEVAHSAGVFRTSGAHSVSCWWYMKDSTAQNAYFMSKLDYNGGVEGFGFQYINGNGLRFNVYRDEGFQGAGFWNQSWSADTWYHIVGTWDTSGSAYLYVDGTERANTALNSSTYTQNSLAFSFHTAFNSSPTRLGFAGRVDEIAFWDRQIQGSEVSEIYNSGTGLFYDDWDASGVAKPPSQSPLMGMIG